MCAKTSDSTMSSSSPSPLDLDFRYAMDSNGQTSGRLRRGVATSQEIVLKDDRIAFEDIHDTSRRDHRLFFKLSPEVELSEKMKKFVLDGDILVLQILKTPAGDVEKHIDRHCSAIAGERERERLAAEGLGHLYRSVQCPHCSATIDLTSAGRTPYTYCRFCESIFDEWGALTSDGDLYRSCDKCGLYGHTQGHTILYFYFLVLIYGFSIRRRHLCDSCGFKIALRTLAANLVFLVGVPCALLNLIRSRPRHDKQRKLLSTANELCAKGQIHEAEPLYQEAAGARPLHPGLLLNLAIGHLRAGRGPDAVGLIDRSLGACTNYAPAIQLIRQLGVR